MIDIKFSQDLKRAMQKNKLSYQLVPPKQHRRNVVERAISMFINHFLDGLATYDPQFPIHEWDCILDQAELTINLLHNSRVNPTLSAHTYLDGIYDFNNVSLASPGTKVLIHSKPDKRASWAFHGEDR